MLDLSSDEGISPSTSFNSFPWEPPLKPPPPSRIEGRWWRHALPGGEFIVVPSIATTSGRGHALGGPGACYFSDSLEAVVAEVLRRFVDPNEIDPSLVMRQFGSARINLDVLDTTDSGTLKALDIRASDLILDDRRLPQKLVSYAAGVGVEGVILPSAALDKARTLVILEAGLEGVEIEATVVAGCNLDDLQQAFLGVRT
jgi:RES domain